MYFSNHNKHITFSFTYGGPLEVETDAKGPVCKEDTDVSPSPDKNWTNKYYSIQLTKGITEAEPGFLEQFKKMNCLIIDRTVKKIAETEELKNLLKKNKVLIRGAYDTYAEQFAKNNGLKFLHSDIFLVVDTCEERYENTFMTLRFFPNGKADIHYNVFCPGISAGNNGGGEYARELPEDFYVGYTIETFADRFPERLRDALLKNEELKLFLQSANKRIKKK